MSGVGEVPPVSPWGGSDAGTCMYIRMASMEPNLKVFIVFIEIGTIDVSTYELAQYGQHACQHHMSLA